MNWQKLIAYILGGVALIVMGWLLHSTFIPKPKTEIKEVVRYDTLTTTKVIKLTETKYINRPVIKDSTRIYADSILGTKNEVDYKIKHTVQDSGKVLSFWEVKLEPKLKTIIQYVTKDSIRTVTETQFVGKPFFLDNWFYTTIVSVSLLVLSLIL